MHTSGKVTRSRAVAARQAAAVAATSRAFPVPYGSTLTPCTRATAGVWECVCGGGGCVCVRVCGGYVGGCVWVYMCVGRVHELLLVR